MKNICIPNPTLYVVEYLDSKGEKTKRTIVPISQTEESIYAWCHLRKEFRHFKKDQIESITSTSILPT